MAWGVSGRLNITHSPTLPHGEILVNCLTFDLSMDLEEAGSRFYQDLMEILNSRSNYIS